MVEGGFGPKCRLNPYTQTCHYTPCKLKRLKGRGQPNAHTVPNLVQMLSR